MGICLDTDKVPDEKNFKNGPNDRQVWNANDIDETYRNDTDMLHSHSHVKFDTPKVPVIFVLGGPGSGKVTHCDNLMIEKRGIVHINMTDLLQQYTVGNDMEDFSKLSSVTVTEVLMLELKMSPAAKTFLISGFPRNMRDVVEYTNKIKIVNGVILISWNQSVLERQIDYGAKLGHVVLSLARMELNNFYKNVTPVSDFYDQRGMLISVNGERSPTEVYNDFRSSVLQTLSAHQATTSFTPLPNGNVVKSNDDDTEHLEDDTECPNDRDADRPNDSGVNHVINRKAADNGSQQLETIKKYPSIICVVGGPGSNKSSLCQKVLRANPGWGHVSVGSVLRSLAPSQESLQETIGSGQFVNEIIVHEILDSELSKHKHSDGIVIDGYPRNIGQLNFFEKKYAQRPKLILLDCSKLQLGRGRLDDSVSAFRRRLESFREHTLPMLKALDRDHRLAVVDGNTEEKDVQEKFIGTLMETMKGDNFPYYQHNEDNDNDGNNGTILQVLKKPLVETVAQETSVPTGPAVPHQNGNIPNNQPNNNKQGQHLHNDVRNMYAQIRSYPNDAAL